VAGGSQMILYLDAGISPDMERVPELTGMSYAKARDTLSAYGLFISTRSQISDMDTQMVSSQSVAAGSMADHGCVVEVSLVDGEGSMLGRY